MSNSRQKRNINREFEVLNSKVRQDGIGEDPVVKALVSDEFTHMKDTEALQVALSLQELVRGQASLMAQQSELISKMNERMDKYDQAAMRWETDREKMLEDIAMKAESLRINDPLNKARFEAGQNIDAKNAIAAAHARKATDRVSFEQTLAMQPKVPVTSPGVIVNVSRNGVGTPTLMPEVIKIKHKTWILQPGVPTEVPLLVAQAFESRKRIKAEGDERKQALLLKDGIMTAQNEAGVVNRKWNSIDQKYKTNAETLPV